METLNAYNPVIETGESRLGSEDFGYLQRLLESGVGIDTKCESSDRAIKVRIMRIMKNDNSLFVFLKGVDKLPFTSEFLLSEKQSAVSFLIDVQGLNKNKASEFMGIDSGAVSSHARRAKLKKELRHDLDVPILWFDAEYGTKLALARGIYVGIRDGNLNMECLGPEPNQLLSYTESQVLYLMCAGLRYPDIAKHLGKKDGQAIASFSRRISAKLGVSGKYKMIAKGLVEMLRIQEQFDLCFCKF